MAEVKDSNKYWKKCNERECYFKREYECGVFLSANVIVSVSMWRECEFVRKSVIISVSGWCDCEFERESVIVSVRLWYEFEREC